MGQAMLYPERIAALHTRKAELGKSCQDIVDDVLDAGEYTSLGTVKKVFSKDAAEKRFKNSSLLPIEQALGIADAKAVQAVAPLTEEFYQRIIRELNQQLKVSRAAHFWKNIAIVFLVAVLGILLLADWLSPDRGWYRSSGAGVWYVLAGLLLAFCVAALVFYLHQKRKKKVIEEAAEKAAVD